MNQSMLCPTCQKPLIQKELHGQQIDECEDCNCMWVDEGELTAMLRLIKDVPEPAVPPANAATVALEQLGVTESIRCPACLDDVPPAVYAYDSGIFVHRCEQCRGTWLESIELVNLAAYQKTSPKVNSLAEAIGSRHRSENRIRKRNSALRSKTISGTVGILSVLLVAMFGGAESAFNTLGSTTVSCMLIWYGDYLGQLVGNFWPANTDRLSTNHVSNTGNFRRAIRLVLFACPLHSVHPQLKIFRSASRQCPLMFFPARWPGLWSS